MEAKLIKTVDGYELFTQGFLKGSTNHGLIDSLNIEEGSIRYKLSLKNCQAIERGYDLDELIKERFGETFWHDGDKYFKEGFQKALEIRGDKKFIQQTEWYVEIVGSGTVYKTVLDCCANYHPKFGCSKKDDCSCKNNELPKLDTDGCLILKRK